MDDVEFRVDPSPERGDEPPGEDVVDVGSRSLPRWAVALGAVIAFGLLGVAVVLRGEHHAPVVQVTEPSASAVGSLAPLPISPVGDAVAHQGNEIALDVALGGNVLYTLRYDLLTTTNATSGAPIGQVHVSGLDYFYGGPTMHLFLDPDALTAWVLTPEVSPPQILEFNSTSLHERRTVVAPGIIYAAAVLSGRLYLATSAGVAVVTPGTGQPTLLPGVQERVEAIAADPARGRLLAVDAESPQHVIAIRAGSPVVARTSIARVISPALAVVGKRIWLAGYNGAGASVWRLDPLTLRPVDSSPVGDRAGPGAQLVAGESVLWVSGGGGLDQQKLWCIDSATGLIGGYWPGLSGAVSSRIGIAYAIRGGEVVTLPTSPGCRG